MKGIKITNLTASVLSLLNKLRRDELAAASKFRFLSVVTAIIGQGHQDTIPLIEAGPISQVYMY